MLEIINCEQGTEEWFLSRLGIPTASEFHTVMAKGKGSAESKTRRTYMLKLLGERLTGEIEEGYTNKHIERGTLMEPEARSMYCFMTSTEVEQVGFIRNGDKGASPDSLIGDNGLLEIKTKLPHRHLDALLKDDVPPEHIAQVQGQIWVAEREWCDFMSYWPKLPPFIKRVYRDDSYINKMSIKVDEFIDELCEIEYRLSHNQ